MGSWPSKGGPERNPQPQPQPTANMENQQAEYNNRKRRFSSAFKSRPPVEALQVHEGPQRPDVFDEVKLGPYVSAIDAKIAYTVWSLPNEVLGREWRTRNKRPFAPPEDEDDKEAHVLSRNVYEHLMLDPLIPVSREDAEVTKTREKEGREFWNTAEMLASWKDDIIRESPIHNVASWTSESIRQELGKRGKGLIGKRDLLVNRLIQDEIESHCGIMRRSDLSHWAIERLEKYALQPATKKNMSALDMYKFAIHLSPYNPAYWVSRAYRHYQLAFFDLALGDVWRAKLLCDTLYNLSRRSKQPGLYTRVWHAIEQHLLVEPRHKGSSNQGRFKNEILHMRELGVAHFIPGLLQTIDSIMDLSMIALNCWKDYFPTELPYRSKLTLSHRDALVPSKRQEVLSAVELAYHEHMGRQNLLWHEKLHGWSPADREYPYETNDVQRTEKSFLAKLNSNTVSTEIREAQNPQGLGVFATHYIQKGDIVHYEEPTIRGHLPPRRMKLDKSELNGEMQCEHCKKLLSTKDLIGEDICDCADHWTHRPDTPGLVFCPTEGFRSCLTLARRIHHFSSCGKSWNWLYDSMRPLVMDYHGFEHIATSNETQGTILSLLLRNVFEITIQRRQEDPDLGPHEIDELLVLEGDGQQWRDSWFPFSMAGNITVPFDILTLLGVDIFRDLSFDTWVIQIVLRKLLTNVVPWDAQRQGRVPDILFTDQRKFLEHPDDQDRRIRQRLSFKDWDPSFMNLYLFPGLSMFNHSCRHACNAEWGYDPEIPNRVVVWAGKNIQKGEEIRIRYRYGKFRSRERSMRFFGGTCLCLKCKTAPPREHDPDSHEIDSADDTDGTVHTEFLAMPGVQATENDAFDNAPSETWQARRKQPQSIDLVPVEIGEIIEHNGVFKKACRRRAMPKIRQVTPDQKVIEKLKKEARRPGQTQEEFEAAFEAARKRWWAQLQRQQKDKEATAHAHEMGIIE